MFDYNLLRYVQYFKNYDVCVEQESMYRWLPDEKSDRRRTALGVRCGVGLCIDPASVTVRHERSACIYD